MSGRERTRKRPLGRPERIAVFGSSLVSAYRNGSATYYRGLLRALTAEGFNVTFFEPDAFERQAHRDVSDPSWARVRVYPPTEEATRAALAQAEEADLVVKASDVGVHDALLEREILHLKSRRRLVAFWDVHGPATLDRVFEHRRDPFRALIPQYDAIFTRGGGPAIASVYGALGAPYCLPIYDAVDPEAHRPAARDLRYACALAFIGNRNPERQARVEELFFSVARRRPQWRFLLGGSGWGTVPDNVVRLGHVYPAERGTLCASALAILNLHSEGMARYGFAPSPRLFEAAGAASCIITDDSLGLETFFAPGRELLVARDGLDVTAFLDELTVARSTEIGQAARLRALAEHTYHHRAATLATAVRALRARRGDVVPFEAAAADAPPP